MIRGGYSTTVKPLITNPPKSGQPLYSGRLTCPRLTLLYITNLREVGTSQLRTTDTDQPPVYLTNNKITSEKRTVKLHPHNADASQPLS